MKYALYDTSGTRLGSDTIWWNSSTQQVVVNRTFDLTQGTYYLLIERYSGSYTGSYTLKTSYTSARESFTESGTGQNNAVEKASVIGTKNTYTGQIAVNDSADYYKITLAKAGKLAFNLTANIQAVRYRLYNAQAQQLSSETAWWNSTTKQSTTALSYDLTKGTYYLLVERYSDSYTGTYTLETNFTEAGESFSEETNNTLADAVRITGGYTYYGQVAINDSADFYRFTLKAGSTFKFTAVSGIHAVTYKLMKADGTELWSETVWWNSSTKQSTYTRATELEAGDYYVVIQQYNSYTGNYNIKISSTTKKIVTYKPAKASFSSLSALTKGIKVKVKKQAEGVGFEVQYAKKKKNLSNYRAPIKTVAAGTRTIRIKNLKKKYKYYVRVRAYRVVDGYTYYSKWSSVKTITTK